MKQEIIRGIKYLIYDKKAIRELREYFTAFIGAFNEVSLWVFNQKLPSYNYRYKYENSDIGQYVTNGVKDIIIKYGIETYLRNIVKAVLSNYKSFKRRNRKEPGQSIKIKEGKSIRFDEACIGDKDNILYFPGLYSKKIKARYSHPKGVKKVKTVKFNKKGKRDNIGGTLRDAGTHLVFTAKNERSFECYTPTDWIGTDFNQTPKYWIILSTPSDGCIIIDKPQSLVDFEVKIEDVCTVLRSRDTKGQKRRHFNNLRVQLHKQHRKLIRPFIGDVVKIVKKYGYGLSIDDVQTGQQKGTWGQDKLTRLLPEHCIREGIPFFLNSSYNTSRRCSKCGYTDKKNKVDNDNFKCLSCGFMTTTHFNAAENCRQSAASQYNV